MKSLLIVMVLLIVVACSKNDIDSPTTPNSEGQPINISITLDQRSMITRSGMSSSAERAIKSIFVLIFDRHGVKVSQSYFNTDIALSLQNIKTVSGSSMSIYVITNLTPQNTGATSVQAAIDDIHTVADLTAMNLYNLAIDVTSNLSLVCYGGLTGQTIANGLTHPFSIQLNFLASRVTLYVINEPTNPADSYTLTDWQAMHYPTKSYLLPRPTDAVAPSSNGDYMNGAQMTLWRDTTIVTGGVSKAAKYAFLYIYENRRGGRRAGAPIDVDPLKKALWAPDSASLIQIRGYYRTTSNVIGLTTKIYLGENSYNDYNVSRGYDYSYVATVRGVNDIGIDTRVENNMTGYKVDVFSTTLDCHADRRPMLISSMSGTVTVSVVGATWLKLSTIDLNRAVDVSGVYKRPTYNPATDMSTSLGVVFASNVAMVYKMIYLYADENLSSTSRSATIQVTSSAASAPTVTIPITQLGYQTMGNVGYRELDLLGIISLNSYVLAVENSEEVAMNITPSATTGTENLLSMQWGYNLTITQPTSAQIVAASYQRNGIKNSANLIYNADYSLKPAFGRLSASSASVASVNISEQLVDPIFNTNSARYCFEKNRDTSGDGLISGNEVQWYLPSMDEAYMIYVGKTALTNNFSGSSYATSSEYNASANSTSLYRLNYTDGSSAPFAKSSTTRVRCVRKLSPSGTLSPYIEPLSTTINNTGFASSVKRTVAVSCPTPIHIQTDAINTQISPRFQVAKHDCLLSGDSGSATITWAQANGWTMASDNSLSTGVVAQTGCQAYSELPLAAGSWRVPTQRELIMIQTSRPELRSITSVGYVDMTGVYWSSTNFSATSAFYITTLSNISAQQVKSTLNRVRCIHDI